MANKFTLKLSDPLWRLSHLYHLKRADDGRVVKFAPRPEQQRVFEMIYKHNFRRIIILKARRLGMSTAIDLLLADAALFNAGTQASIVDQTAADAERKLSTICKVAYEYLAPELKDDIKLSRDSGSIMEVQSFSDAPSAIFAGLRARGGTNNLLHISEWGTFAADDPRRSEEILTGAVPSAEHGTILIETTWKGGRGGHLWELVKDAMETPEEHKTPKDWRVVFFPWWSDPTYVLQGDPATINKATAEYLDDMQSQTGHTFSDEQRLWYDRQAKQLGMFIFREFPTTVEECFKSPVEGAIYASELDKLRAAGAIGPIKVDNSYPVHTSWDIGSPVNTVCWYWQLVAGNEVRVIDCDLDLDLTPVQRVAHMMSKGYNYGNHYLPHDASAQKNTSGRSDEAELRAAGLNNTRIVPRTHDIWIGINRLQQMLPRFSFRLPHCEAGVTALSNYAYKRASATGIVVHEPVHNWASHAADALRMLAEAEAASMLKTGTAPREPAVVVTGIRDLGWSDRRAVVRR